jgi:manganese transport protein
MLPALIIIGVGINTTAVLILSQVVLSLVLPVPVFMLLVFTSSRRIMGDLANSAWMRLITAVVAIVIVGLNLVLLWQLISGRSMGI